MLDDDQLRLRVGVITVLVVAAAFGATSLLKGRFGGKGITVQVELEHIGSLREGTPVRASGAVLGKVTRIAFVPRGKERCRVKAPGARPQILVDLWISSDRRNRVFQKSEIFADQGSILAPQHVEVLPPPPVEEPGPLAQSGEYLCGTSPPSTDQLLSRTLENVMAIREASQVIAPHAALFAIELNRLADNISYITGHSEHVAKVADRIGGLASETRAFASDIEREIPPGSLTRIQRNTNRGAALLGKTNFADRFAQIGSSFELLTTLLPADKREQMGRDTAVFRAALASAEQSMAKASEIAGAIENARGVLGLLLQDRELFDDVKEMSRMLKLRPFKAGGVPPAQVDE